MVPRGTRGIRRTSRPYRILPLHVADVVPPIDPESSIPWHAAFVFLIPALLVILQVHCQGSSPLRTHPANMWTFMICLLIYCFALGYYIKAQISYPTYNHEKLLAKVAVISGSLASAALISILVSRSLQPVVFIICLILVFLYFARNPLTKKCENVVAQVNNIWKRITGGNNNPIIGSNIDSTTAP